MQPLACAMLPPCKPPSQLPCTPPTSLPPSPLWRPGAPHTTLHLCTCASLLVNRPGHGQGGAAGKQAWCQLSLSRCLASQAGSAAMDVDGPSNGATRVPEGPSLLGLPANVLINILGKACPSPYDRRLLFTLALVCRRFANVLRQPSELWNTMLLSLPKCAHAMAPSAERPRQPCMHAKAVQCTRHASWYC